MGHKVKPGQLCVIKTVEIAFPADMPEGNIADELSGMLTEHGTASPNSDVLDWRYIENDRLVETRSTYEPVEGEIFNTKRTNLPKRGVRKTLKQLAGRGRPNCPSVVVTLYGLDSRCQVDCQGGDVQVEVVNFDELAECDSCEVGCIIRDLTDMPTTPSRERTLAILRKLKKDAETREAREAPIPGGSI